MTDKELIKQEIERLKQTNGYLPIDNYELCDAYRARGYQFACDDILKFIDSLPEEPDCEKKDYRERYEKLTQSDTFKSSYCDKSLGKEESTDEANCTTKSEDLKEAAFKYRCEHKSCDAYTIDAFKAGAEWQKQKNQETIELAEDHAMLAGMMKEREEMMKDAVDATIVNDWQYGKDPDHAVIPAIHQRIKGYNVGDKVKIIIIKEE